MNVEEYLEEMKNIQTIILDFLENETDVEENFQKLNFLLDDKKVRDKKYKVKSILHLILKISDNHQRCPDFFSKIEKILLLFKESITKYYSNSEIFNIFKSNKRILLFLIEEKILIVDEYFVKKIIVEKFVFYKYPQYFAPEIKPFFNERWFPKSKNYSNIDKSFDSFLEDDYLPSKYGNEDAEWIDEVMQEVSEDFYEKRKIGENDDLICQLIREDMIKDFIIYANKNKYSIKNTIKPSVFETNSLLIKINDTTLIEYAAFYGSIQIFQYLKKEGFKLTHSLWNYAVHGRNSEIIHLLEENDFEDKDFDEKDLYNKIIDESIKSHHNNIVYYVQNNLLDNYKDISSDSFKICLKYYNFAYVQTKLINENIFSELIKYDYYYLLNILLNESDVDLYTKLI